MWIIYHICFFFRCLLSPNHSDENQLHAAAKKAGLSIGCPIQYLDVPMCVGHSADGTPVVEIKQWPFLLPSDMAPWNFNPKDSPKTFFLKHFNWWAEFNLRSEAQTLVDEGYLSIILDFERMATYWDHMLLDFTDHPARLSPTTSMPISLYGNLDSTSKPYVFGFNLDS